MLCTSTESTEDYIIRVLTREEKNVKELQRALHNNFNKTITIQPLYRIIKKLVHESVLVKKDTRFMVSNEWKQKIIAQFGSTQHDILAEGETISYSFKSLSALDSYWKHTMTQLRALHATYPIFFYNRHVIWLHLKDRKESQTNFLHSFDQNKQYAGFVVGGNTALDKEFKKQFYKTYLQVDLRPIASLKSDSVTVYGEYIVSVKFKKKTGDFIDTLYKNNDSAVVVEATLDRSLEGKLPIALTLERNKKKAEKMRKMLAKNFAISLEVNK